MVGVVVWLMGAAGVFLLWSAVTGRNPIDELKAAVQ